ncbi:MAG: helix-turn-helix domain-containing protein [Myxococcota bacterium]
MSVRSIGTRRATELTARKKTRVGPKPSSGNHRPAPSPDDAGLEALVEAKLGAYIDALRGHLPRDLYQLIMPQLERPLIKVAMRLSDGRQAVAATMLGIHRNTLRTKLKELGLDGVDWSKR